MLRAGRDLFDEDPSKQAMAQSGFMLLGESALNVLLKGAAGVGHVLATAALEGATIGMVALGPPLEDLIRDYVGPVFKELLVLGASRHARSMPGRTACCRN